jgi:hypothetical protein
MLLLLLLLLLFVTVCGNATEVGSETNLHEGAAATEPGVGVERVDGERELKVRDGVGPALVADGGGGERTLRRRKASARDAPGCLEAVARRCAAQQLAQRQPQRRRLASRQLLSTQPLGVRHIARNAAPHSIVSNTYTPNGNHWSMANRRHFRRRG